MNKSRLKLALLGKVLLDRDHVKQLEIEEDEQRVYLDSGMRFNMDETILEAQRLAREYRYE